jgi:hypothetical protein
LFPGLARGLQNNKKMPNKPITIKTKNNSPQELKAKKILDKILADYPCPIFTNEIIIDQNAVSRSHPVLTLGTSWNVNGQRKQYSEMTDGFPFLSILENFVHEQFHWFVTGHQQFKACIDYLQINYIDQGDCNTGKNAIDFWVHLIVRWNTRNFFISNLEKEKIDYLYGQWRPQPKTEKFVKENFEKLRADLEKFDMAYK